MQKYYLLSLKHTSPKDAVFTFWRANAMGYSFLKGSFGIYSERDALVHADPGKHIRTAIMVGKELIDSLCSPIMYEGKMSQGLPLNSYVFELLGITSADLQAKGNTTMGVEFVLDSNTENSK